MPSRILALPLDALAEPKQAGHWDDLQDFSPAIPEGLGLGSEP